MTDASRHLQLADVESFALRPADSTAKESSIALSRVKAGYASG